MKTATSTEPLRDSAVAKHAAHVASTVNTMDGPPSDSCTEATAHDFLSATRDAVEARLDAFFHAQRATARERSPVAAELVDAVASLTMRGGKRVRALVIGAAHAAVDPEARPEASAAAGASMELLQSYLLIHDDWMDRDETRRGGPAVHTMFRAAGRDVHDADSLGILAGDLACTMAWELMLSAPFRASRRAEALESFVTLQRDVYFGQQLDVIAHPDVSRIHTLKTGSYTVLGPARLGAALGGASAAQRQGLERWAGPLGRAFQLRDDILGTYPEAADKPGDDLRHGKETALVVQGRRLAAGHARRRLDEVFGLADAPDTLVAQVAQDLEACGARAAVEAECEALRTQSEAALMGADFTPEGRACLRHLGRRMTRRTS